MKINLTKEQIEYCYDLAKKRHDAKHKSFRNKSQIIPSNKGDSFESELKFEKEYMPHFLGIVGELAWSLYSGDKVDENIYKVRDNGEDFDGIEVRTITYKGNGEPELKVKVAEYESKNPQIYVLTKFDLEEKSVTILGRISRENFDQVKVKKKYGRFLPLNYVVPLSLMEKL
jgi:hypothetical protein